MSNSIEKAHIRYQPLGDEIHIARLDKSGRCALSKVDRTAEFMEALLQWCEPGSRREISDGKKVLAVVSVMQPPELTALQGRIIAHMTHGCRMLVGSDDVVRICGNGLGLNHSVVVGETVNVLHELDLIRLKTDGSEYELSEWGRIVAELPQAIA